MLQQAHLPSLDGLRGVSILIVLVFHVLQRNKGWNFNGMFGVNIFFVISGFIITTLLLKEKCRTKQVSLKKFYIRRFLKILPVAYLFLLVVILLNLHYHFVSKRELLSSVLFIKNTSVLSSNWDWSTGHFWSLSVEEQFYIFFPFILKKSTNKYMVTILFLLVTIPVLLILEQSNAGFFGTRGMHIFLDFFRFIIPILAGALCALLIFKKVIVKRLYPNHIVLNLLLLFLAYFCYSTHGVLHEIQCNNLFSSVIVAAVIANNIACSKNLFFRLINSKLLVTIGLASYSIYVWQQIFLLQVPWAHAFRFAGDLWFNILAMALVSSCSYYFIERKLAKLKSKYR